MATSMVQPFCVILDGCLLYLPGKMVNAIAQMGHALKDTLTS